MSNFKCQISNRSFLLEIRNWKLEIKNYPRGFTLVELLIVMSFFGILAGLATINLMNTRQSTSIDASLNIIIAYLREQQIKAMVGDTEGRSTQDTYGIYLGDNSTTYTLFHGSYSESEQTNHTVSLTDTMEVSTTFPDDEIVFEKGSGNVSGFTEGLDTITITDPTTGAQRVITVNRYGVITDIY